MKSLKTPISKEKYTQIKSEMTSSYIAATKYFDKHLHNKDILILAKGQVFKASFLKKNFFHLCGVDSYIRPWEFYNKAAAGQLKPKHFTFSKDHTMSAAYTKSQALPLLFKAICEGNTKNISILSELKATKRDLPFSFAFHIENPGEECSLCFDYSEDDGLVEAYSTRGRKQQRETYKEDLDIDYIFIKDSKSNIYEKVILGDIASLKSYVIDRDLLNLPIDYANLSPKKDKLKFTFKGKENEGIINKNNSFLKKYDKTFEKLGAEIPEYKLTKADIIAIHDRGVTLYGGISGVRDEGLLDASISNPYQSVFGSDLYPTIFDKAAKYMFDFAHYQIFNDGNKRTGLATMGIFLEANGYEFIMDDKDAYQFTMDIANNRYEEIPDIANIIKENTIFADVDKSIFLNESIIYKENDNMLENEDECHDRD